MKMSDQKKEVLQPQRIRTLRDRRGGSTVPAPAMSSSNDGRSSACPAGALVDNAPATNEARSDQEDRGLSLSEGETNRRAAPCTDTDGEFLKLPRLIGMEVVKKARRKVGPKSRTRPSAATKKNQPSTSTGVFGTIRPSAGSPPPTALTETCPTTATEDDARSAPQQSSVEDASMDENRDTDVINLDSSDATDVSIRTTASGASKRSRRRNREVDAKARRVTARTDRSLSSSEENFFEDMLEGKKKKRGRPIVTGKGVEILAIKEKTKELESIKDEIRLMKQIAEGGYDPSDYKGKRRSQMAERIEQESAGLPVQAMAAEILQTAKKIEEVAVKSSNLKGGFVRILREAALKIEINADAMTRKVLPMQSTDAQEVEQLRAEVRQLREELDRVRSTAMTSPLSGNNQVRDEPMEMDTGAESSHVPAPPSVTLPPREEWPPAIRPPVQGKSRILTDDDEETLKSKNTTLRRKAANKDKGLEELIDGKLAVFAKMMQAQMRDMMSTLTERLSPQVSPNGAQESTSMVSGLRDHTKKHPVPEEKNREDKSKKTKKNKGQGPSNVSPLENNKAQPSKKKKDAPPAPSENLQTCSGSTSNPVETPWTKVLGRNAARKNKQVMKPVASTSAPGTITKGAPGIKRGKVEGKKTSSSNTSTKKKRKRRNRRRIPKTSAVVLTCPQKDMPKILSEARDKIKLPDIGITDGIKTRFTATGALLLEVPGESSGPQADALAARLRELLVNREGIKINRPIKMAEIRVRNLEPSLTVHEVIGAVASKGGCLASDIKAGSIRSFPGGLGSLWMSIPLVAAKKATEGNTLKVGWTKVKVDLLESRPLRCYKCLQRGHVADKCPETLDRSGRCYRCGEQGHVAKMCRAPPKCPICSDLKRKANHANVGRSKGAQDLLLHTMAEQKMIFAVVAEPNYVPKNHPCWTGDELGSVALTWRWIPGTPSCAPIERGQRYVAARWGPTIIVGTYLPPSGTIEEYQKWLDDIAVCIRRVRNSPIIVAGDFNAWSTTWGSARTNARGRLVEAWAASMDLVLLNRGNTSTCVRPQGESIIDLSWASPAAARIVSGWKVSKDMEHLSDHRYILVSLAPLRSMSYRSREGRRWAVRKLDEDAFQASIAASLFASDLPQEEEDPEIQLQWVTETVTRACDMSMPRVKHRFRRSAYWWSDQIAALRRDAIRTSRKVTRSRDNQDRRAEALATYKEARKTLRTAIRKAKEESWTELIEALDDDPWGRAYKIVCKKLRPMAPPITEVLAPQFLKEVIGKLFPPDTREDGRVHLQSSDLDWNAALEITEEEFLHAAKRGLRGNTAPGPDGLTKAVWRLALKSIQGPIIQLFNSCLRHGAFPLPWKKAKLVLLRKQGKPEDSPSAYRPICLLDEAGKLFERIIVNRLVQHLSKEGTNFSRNQFGFRAGISTVNAITAVRNFTEEHTSQGGVVLATSIDVSNAFNSLPWEVIRAALSRHQVPQYLKDILGSYLHNRYFTFTDHNGKVQERSLQRGVPQGSVLGPFLWNIGYDAVFSSALPPHSKVVCYADDTLILSGGRDWTEARARGEIAASSVLRSVQKLGLYVAHEKTEAIVFSGKTGGPQPPPSSQILVGAARIQIAQNLKYLGLILDHKWSFGPHFKRIGERVREKSTSLRGILPNIGGPSSAARRLYANTVRSIALYAAPVWAEDLAACKKSQKNLEAAFHQVAIRTARAYRTVARPAAALLAGLPPVDITAAEYHRVYKDLQILKSRGITPTAGMKKRLRRRHRVITVGQWKDRLTGLHNFGQRTLSAILPVMEDWVDRCGWKGVTSFWTTQIITGHGCFSSYLHRIGKEASTACHHCDDSIDDAQHTLEVCPAWTEERQVLRNVLGPDLSLPTIIELAVYEDNVWRAFMDFCSAVMRRKTEAERERERHPQSAPSRSNAGGNHRGTGQPSATTSCMTPAQALTPPASTRVLRSRPRPRAPTSRAIGGRSPRNNPPSSQPSAQPGTHNVSLSPLASRPRARTLS
ncbi:uncharacterized protein [Cardiocondyla obscurior]|uniref:uncharacterized protein n=1 Tax=Cardiocondyla obscurior TaxID=286306 RepID=UPI0039657718